MPQNSIWDFMGNLWGKPHGNIQKEEVVKPIERAIADV